MNRNNTPYRLFIFLLFAMAVLPLSHGQKDEAETFFNKESWQEVTKKADYKEYYKEKDKKERKKRDLNFNLNPIVSAGVMKTILIVLIIGVLSFVLFLILKNTFNFFAEKVPESQLLKVVEELEDNIHEADFDSLLKKALENDQFKLAVRIFYLHIIKMLSDKSLIQWKRNKTNGQYVRELASHGLGNNFSFITSVYEQAWFSQYPVSGTNYRAISENFRKFMEGLK